VSGKTRHVSWWSHNYWNSGFRPLSSIKKNTLARVRERTMPTERPALVSEFAANFCGKRMSSGQRDGSLRPYSRFSRSQPLLFLSGSSSNVLTSLSGPRSRPTTSQKVFVAPGIEPGPLDL
jgi:hypothetical protein